MYELHWGILGAGNISGQFVQDLVTNNQQQQQDNKTTSFRHIIESIGTSSISKGEQFITEYKINKQESNFDHQAKAESYTELYNNPLVNVVYIGTPHTFHKEQVINCLNHGKNVLCEKPITINAAELEELIQLAKQKGLFLMEAVWTRFIPLVTNLQKILFEEKKLGDLKRLMCDFTCDADIGNLPSSSRVRDNSLGGGALLDIGIYCITYARVLLLQSDTTDTTTSEIQMKSFQTIDPTDHVDYNSSILLKYANGSQAILTCSNHGTNPSHVPFLKLQGTKGYLEIFGANAARPERCMIYLKENSTPIELVESKKYNGFIHEANAVAKYIAEGKLESEDTIPLKESLLVMRLMDQIRSENGLTYPADTA